MRILLFVIVFWSLNAFTLWAQNDEFETLTAKFLSDIPFKQKQEANKMFTALLTDVLNSPDNFGFNELPPNISVLKSPDQKFNIYTWTLSDDEGNYHNQGMIQLPPKKGNASSVIPLMNISKSINNVQQKILSSDEWIGAIYYQIIPVKVKKKKFYILLGVDANNKLTRKKLIDVIWFDGEEIKFGYPIFQTEKKLVNRVIFEYSAQTSMSLRYQKKTKMIIFDHLAPSNPTLQGQFQFYGPDFSYDAFEFKNNKWVYVKDVDARNDSENLGKKVKDVQKKF